ncbi:MAG: hypothetical protein ACLFNT_02615 [Spirochaetales bacterium]
MRVSSRWLVTGATLLLVLIAVGLTVAVSQSGYWERWQQGPDELEPMDPGDAVETLSARLTAELERRNNELAAERARLLGILARDQGTRAEERRIEAEVAALERELASVGDEIAAVQSMTSETFEIPVTVGSGGPAASEPLDPTPAPPRDDEPDGTTEDAELRRAELEELQSELQTAASRIDSLEREGRRLVTALSNAERIVEQTRERLSQREAANSALQTRLESEAARRRELESQIDAIREEMGREQARATALFSSSSILAVFYEADGEVRVALHPEHRDRVLRQATFNVYAAGSDRERVKSRVNVREQNGVASFSAFPGFADPEPGDWF